MYYNPYDPNPYTRFMDVSQEDSDISENFRDPFTAKDRLFRRISWILAGDMFWYIICTLAFINLAQVYAGWYIVVGIFGIVIIWALYSLIKVCRHNVYGWPFNSIFFWYIIYRSAVIVMISFLIVLFLWITFALTTGSGDQYTDELSIIDNLAVLYGITATIMLAMLLFMALTYRPIKNVLIRWARHEGDPDSQ